MNREEFLRGLEDALAGEVPQSVIRDNVNYYGSYISQEMAKGRTVDEIVDEIGDPRIVAKTIIDSSEASGETSGGSGYGSYRSTSYSESEGQSPSNGKNSVHYIDLNKWYWKLLAYLLLFMIVSLVFRLIGGIFALLIRFSGPLMMFFLVYWIVKNFKK